MQWGKRGVYSKLGYTGVHLFLIFTPKHRLWVLVRTASKKSILNGQVFVMLRAIIGCTEVCEIGSILKISPIKIHDEAYDPGSLLLNFLL